MAAFTGAAATAVLPAVAASAGPRWTRRFDFDGDGTVDPIEVGFSGGAHCCYTLAIESSRTHRRIALPGELDGGYVGGLDLSRPDQFDVAIAADGRARISMWIETYGLDVYPIPRSYRRRWGITSHHLRVGLDVKGTGLVVENLPE